MKEVILLILFILCSHFFAVMSMARCMRREKRSGVS
jgi:hypothetical protein